MSLAPALRSAPGRTALMLLGAGAVALFAGCGDDAGSSAGGTKITATTGHEIWKAANCGSCHTLAAENATGVIGPNLDDEKPGADKVIEKVTNGDGTMPSFSKRLSTQQIQSIADYVSSVAGK